MAESSTDAGTPPVASKLHKGTLHRRKPTLHLDDSAPGICRICRGEGSPEEPLFYPCKCSGSIQHVHQDCLMEWLSHSQKKYCELCKTSFRFTKFYNPNMPSSLPITVFFRQLVRYSVQNSLGWLRAIVAISFWVSWLPWFMRRGWSCMFWVSQESWGSDRGQLSVAAGAAERAFELASSITFQDVCPSSPLFASIMTPVSASNPVSSFWDHNFVLSFVVRCLMRIFGIPVSLLPSSSDSSLSSLQYSQSLLGDVKFLRNLTRSSSINQTIISVLEGQIITVVAIVSFILVILVRDYVVQQQPDINNRAPGFEPDEPLPELVPVDPFPDQEFREDAADDSQDEELTTDGHTGLSGGRSLHQEPRAEFSGLEYEYPIREMSIQLLPGPEVEDERPGTATFGQGPPQSSRSSDWDSSEAELTPETSDRSQSDHAESSSTLRKSKGKEKAVDPAETTSEQLISWLGPEAGPSRPRSVSDGPQIHNTIHPLANNTWSFGGPPGQSNGESSKEPEQSTGLNEENITLLNKTSKVESSPVNRKFNGIRDQIDSTEALYIPPLEGHIIRIPSPQPAPPAPREQPFSPTKWLADKATAFMWTDLDDAEQESPPTPDSTSEEGDPESGDEVHDGAYWNNELNNLIAEQEVGETEMAALDAELPPMPDNDQALMADDPDAAAEAIEDMEDFEGIMELLGMRGPITNLFQNVIFCAVLVQTALIACIFTPFNIGRISIWFLAKPTRLVRVIFELSKMAQDLVFVVGGFLSWMLFNLVDMVIMNGNSVSLKIKVARKASWTFFHGAGARVAQFLALDAPGNAGMQHWSAVSRQALLLIKENVSYSFLCVGNALAAVFKIRNPVPVVVGTAKFVLENGSSLTALLASPSSWVIDLGSGKPVPVNLSLAYWSASDITWALLAGYITILALAAIYLNSGIRFARGTVVEEVEAGIIDTLHQASGILKVITIISIEMLVFPLYCGLLLDCAVLPLFAGATIKSRMLFTYNNPWTSAFVHWFIGTGYMFHFALFVSMCRKIMRPGVLYFIRDPDDPEFHPVRDVLERNLTTQLRKILFSAFVYGTLVIVCLGGVVWGLAYTTPNVIPIHYSSNEPVLEFPVDLLFYNFFMPLAFRLFKPGDGLHAMYRWCFRKSARLLRLTYFLFGERCIEEEGTLHLAPDSPHANLPIWRRPFLGLNADKDKVIPKSWSDIINGINPHSQKSTSASLRTMRKKKAHLTSSNQLTPNGRFVRAPATDRVKIPKGKSVFLDVTERNAREDNALDAGLYASESFQMVYIPPNLLTRIGLFILAIWTFAAVTGVGLTILPLMLGRVIFTWGIPEHVRTNDVYAFCIGIHVIGLVAYCITNARRLLLQAKGYMHRAPNHTGSLQSVLQAIKLGYAYGVMFVVCPLGMAALVELYIALPVHSYMNPTNAAHHVRIVEAWTLGLLYMRLAIQLSKSLLPNTRFVTALRAVLRRGYLDPDIRIITRAFLIPGVLILSTAIFGPPSVVRLLSSDGVDSVRRYRQSYPMLFAVGFVVRYAFVLRRGFRALKVRVRDDAYLMGERLQNYDGSGGRVWGRV